MHVSWGALFLVGSLAFAFKLARSKTGGFVLALLHIRVLKLVRSATQPRPTNQRALRSPSVVEDNEDNDEEGVPFSVSPTQGGSKSG
jgi:hypothetical protein